jgi:hypothetical protein
MECLGSIERVSGDITEPRLVVQYKRHIYRRNSESSNSAPKISILNKQQTVD